MKFWSNPLGFGLTTIATVTGCLLIGAVVVGYGLLATAVYRSGYASARLIVLMAVLALAGTIAYAICVGVFAPGLRSPEATLNHTVLRSSLAFPRTER